MLNKSYIYASSQTGRSYTANDLWNDNNYYEIPVNLPISIPHIFVLVLYFDFNELQYLYKKHGCREYGVNEEINDVKKRNMEMGNWYKLLKKCIHFYGTKATSSDTFYTGLNTKLAFSSYVPHINCPISESVSWQVANEFANKRGIILQLQGVGEVLVMYILMRNGCHVSHMRKNVCFLKLDN